MDPQVLGWIATFLFTVCYVPQIARMMYYRSVAGVSFWFLLLPLCANIIALSYAVAIHQNPLIVKYFAGIVVSCVCLFAYILIAYDD